ncbi:MAG: hypothetical protein BMS9Abin33_0293 [Gammaproteobacteria bacterium]|nr:MAG: hypothetical protein BMS9Abin33_0293 [Gammaproteobacteria bacterium]
MGTSRKKPAAQQTGNPLPPLNIQQKESLLMLIVLNYAEEHGLLNEEQLEDARASLRALFLRATGEETMLRKMIGLLKINKSLNQAFSDMTHIMKGIGKSRETLANKHKALTKQLESMDITVDENGDFVGPLLEFSSDFVNNVAAFERQMTEYKEVRENEARTAHIFRLAQEARERLKSRFDQGTPEDGQHEKEVKKKVFQSFNYADAESNYKYAKRSADSAGKEIEGSLKQFHQMCQMAMKPEMRSPDQIKYKETKKSHIDIYKVSIKAMKTYPRLKSLIPSIQEILRLYQNSFGMFMLDFEKFNKAIVPMTENTEDYFHAKEQDEDVRAKQKKLRAIESLIAFIEAVSRLLKDGRDYTYPAFSSAVTKQITLTRSGWKNIAEELLRMKVTAEAELSTRLA